MIINNIKIKIIILTVFILPAFLYVYPQFIEDNEDIEINIEKKKSKENTNSGAKGLPEYMAFGIKAEKAKDVKNAAVISFNANTAYLKNFAVGRSNEIIDSKDRVLSAMTVKEVFGRDKNVVVDMDLKPGKYYYVVMAKEKLLSRNVELFKDVNYTTAPVIIESDPRERFIENVTMLQCEKISEGKIALKWKKLEVTGILYTIYRSKGVIDTSDKLALSEKAGVVVDKDAFLDAEAVFKGSYYYAVTVKEINGKENIILKQGQNYTVNAILIEDNIKAIVSNLVIKTDYINVILEWIPAIPKTGLKVTEYVIYRSSQEIINTAVLSSSLPVGSVKADRNTYRDTDLKPGKYFYAVLAKLSDGMIDQALKKGQNFSFVPVEIREPYTIADIKAVWNGGRVFLSWNYSGYSGDIKFRLFRSPNLITTLSELDRKWIYKTVNISEKRFVDEKPFGGEYYYGLIPNEKYTDPALIFLAGVNITSQPVSTPVIPVPDDKSGQSNKIDTGDKKDNITIEKDIDGFEIIDGRSRKTPENRENPVDEGKIPIESLSGIDGIIQKYFITGYYKTAIKQLQDMTFKADNLADMAKAKLFIARSYIELKEYDKALDYLIQDNVKKYFPKESEFWKDYVLLRIK
jgi:hypothetical protein